MQSSHSNLRFVESIEKEHRALFGSLTAEPCIVTVIDIYMHVPGFVKPAKFGPVS